MKCCGREEKGEGGRDLSLQPSPRETGTRRQSQKETKRERETGREREMENVHTNTCTWLFTAVFLTVRKWEHPKCPSMDERITKCGPLTHRDISPEQERGANTCCPGDRP